MHLFTKIFTRFQDGFHTFRKKDTSFRQRKATQFATWCIHSEHCCGNFCLFVLHLYVFVFGSVHDLWAVDKPLPSSCSTSHLWWSLSLNMGAGVWHVSQHWTRKSKYNMVSVLIFDYPYKRVLLPPYGMINYINLYKGGDPCLTDWRDLHLCAHCMQHVCNITHHIYYSFSLTHTHKKETQIIHLQYKLITVLAVSFNKEDFAT